MIKSDIIKKILAIIFSVSVIAMFFLSDGFSSVERAYDYLAGKEEAYSTVGNDQEFADGLWERQELLNMNGAMARAIKMQGYYGDMDMYVTDDRCVVSASPYTTTDYEYDQIVSFYEFCQEHGIKMLYVNEPNKYVDDSIFSEGFGVASYSNSNMDLFMERIRAAGIPAIDLRDNIREEGLNISDLFYRTDHHWTTKAALWATKIIVEGMNEYCGYDIDSSIYDIENYDLKEWKNCWLGEQGRKVAESYVGLDDFTEIKPKYETSYLFKSGKKLIEGTFDNFVVESIYNLENDVYENQSWHYSYQQKPCINQNADYGKVLLLGDSYEQVTDPFLSLSIHELDPLILREYDDTFSLRNYILENGYDTVLVCYAQFMVGEHDDEYSANYRMFTFEY